MADPIIPFSVSVKGSSSSGVGDTIRVTVYGATAKGTTTTTLDSDKEATVELANFAPTYSSEDTIVVSANGKGLVGANTTISGKGGKHFDLTSTAVAFPARTF